MRKSSHALHLFAASATMFAMTLSGGCCYRTYSNRTNVASTSFAPSADSAATTSLDVFRIVSVDGHGRADESISGWGDLVLSTGAAAGGTLFLSGHAVADALVETQTDLRAAQAGTVLAGAHFDLDCSRQGDGTCLAYDSWVGATASGSIDVVAAASAQAALLTFDISAKVIQSTGEVVPVHGVLTLDLQDEKILKEQSGDCS